MTTAIPALVRPAFFDGQRLEAADLAAIYDFHRTLRWLHNRTLHGWGIVTGLGVTGARGDRQVTVAPGYALDAEGRDLLVAAPAVLPVPAVAGAAGGGSALYYLTISYLPDEELPIGTARDGVCDTGGMVRRDEAALLRWQSPTDPSDPETRYRRGLDVILASVEVLDCQLAAAPATDLRRDVRPPCAPYVAAGSTAPGSTTWTTFPVGAPGGAIQGVEAVVDTSAAGFQRTPSYGAQLLGSRTLPLAGETVLVDGTASIHAAGPTSFVLRVLLPRDLTAPPLRMNPAALFTPELPNRVRDTLRWSVSWTGAEG